MLKTISAAIDFIRSYFIYGFVGRMVTLDASSYCQLECPLCIRCTEDMGVVGKGNLRFSDFKWFADKYPKIKRIELSHWGEMFLNPDLGKIIKYAHENNIILSASNGVNLNNASEEILQMMVEYSFSELRVAIDGATEGTYKTYRKGGDINKVIDNIKTINTYKKKYKTNYPHLIWAYVVFGHNEHELPMARKLAKELDMTFVPFFNFNPAYSPINNKEQVKKELGGISEDEYQKISGNICQGMCEHLWFLPHINWDGRLLGCCVNRWGDFGNIFNKGLRECIKSEKYVYAKKMLLGKEKARDDIPCYYCPVYKEIASSSQLEGSMLKRLRKLKLPFKMLEIFMIIQHLKEIARRHMSCKV